MADQQEIITRHTLAWLLLVNIAVLAPLHDKMTSWTLAICAICFVWRVGIFSAKVARPPRYLVTLLALASAATLVLVTSQIGMLNGLINLLILGYALKYIEMRDRRDVRAVVVVGFFLIAITFIEKQSLWFTLQLTLVATLNLAVLLSLYRENEAMTHTAKRASQLLLQSVPLAILLFIVLPRLPPLWLVPNANNATTGLSDTVSFGDINQLTRSPALAFRVSFDNEPPQHQQRYWRALVMEHYDGKSWTPSAAIKQLEANPSQAKAAQRQRPVGQALQYQVIAEPSHQHWLFGLDLAYSPSDGVINLPDGRLYAISSVEQQYQYRVASYTEASLDSQLSEAQIQGNLQLPARSNPKTLALAERFKQSYPDPQQRMAAMMRYFNESPYYYTLQPPPVGPQQIDDFLFENQAGFCVHYASALAFMARQTGIPARLVTGYQGGEWNQSAQYLSVYQYMAHAWVEAWLPGHGWTRFDPTAMIAPERVEQGFDAFFNPADSYLQESPFSSLRLRQYPLLNQLRLSIASIDYYWSKWVLGFDNQRQQQLLKRLLGDVDSTKLAILIICTMALIGVAIAYSVGLLQFQRQPDRLKAGFDAITALLAKKGLPRETDEPPQRYAQRVATHLPTLAVPLQRYIDCYMALKYQPHSPSERQALQQQITRYRRQLRLAILSLNSRQATR